MRGMTLVELLVAMVIGLGVTLAITSLLVAGENHKRTTTSTNDAEQTGAYSFYAIDKVLRGAGSAIVESTYPTDHGVLGCKLNAAAILPRTSAFPVPFAGFLGGTASNLRAAPLVIGSGQSAAGSDVLMVMNGSGAAGGVSRQVTGTGTAATLILDNVVGFVAHDIVLVSQPGTPDCLLEEVTTPITTPTLPLASTLPYYSTGGINGGATTISTLAASTSSYVTPLGNADANNIQFSIYGVGANRTLYSYDILQNLNLVQGSGPIDAVQAVADGVDSMYAIYGLDTNGDGIQDTWVSPAAAPYDAATVMTTPATQLQIVSVRIALVVRGEYYDKNQVSPTTLTYFSGLTNSAGTTLPALKQTVALSANDQHYRYRVFEFTVPLRNMIVLAGGP
jgi:type IV pilus assembly protein PilW